MKKWNNSGRYGLTRGLKRRFWSFYNSFKQSTGEDYANRFLEGGLNPNEYGGSLNELAYAVLAEDESQIEAEDGAFIMVE